MSKFNTDVSLEDIEKIIGIRRSNKNSDVDPFTGKSSKFENPYKNQSLSNLKPAKPVEPSERIQEQQQPPGNSMGGPPNFKVKVIHYPELMTDNEISTVFRTMLRNDSGALEAQKEFVKFNRREELGITNTEALTEWKNLRADNNLTFSFRKSDSGSLSMHVLHYGQAIAGGNYKTPNEMIENTLNELQAILKQSQTYQQSVQIKPEHPKLTPHKMKM